MENLQVIFRKHLSEMCLKYPTYHTASPGERDRADYIERTFRSYGLKTRREAFGVRGWEFRSFSFFDVTAGKEVPLALCEYFSCSVDFEGTLLIITPEQMDQVEQMDVAGQVVFVTGEIGTFANGDFAEKLESLGAKAVIFAHLHPDVGMPHTKLVRSPYINNIGTCVVGPLGSVYLTSNPDHIYRLQIDAKPYDAVSENILAYVEGDDKKVVFGAHYDSAPHTQGAGDNASGTAMLLEMARLMKDKGRGHTMEFVAFTAEEYCERPPAKGPKGSNAYVAMHRGENIACYINFDDYCISHLLGPERLCVGRIEKLPPIQWHTTPEKQYLASDDVSFYYAGYPVIHMTQAKQVRVLHTIHDDLDYVNVDTMAIGTERYFRIATQLLERL